MQNVIRRFFRRSVNQPEDEPTPKRLYQAIEQNDVPMIKQLILKRPELLNYANDIGETPLHWAAGLRKISSLGCLVDLGADTKKETLRGLSPAVYASEEIRMGCPTDLCRIIHERLRAGPIK